MQRIFSARLDEAALDEMERVTRKLKMTKRQFLEEAIHLRARQLGEEEVGDIWSETRGAWNRREKGGTTIRKVRDEFERSFGRHHRGKHARLHR